MSAELAHDQLLRTQRPRIMLVSSRRTWPPFPGSHLRASLQFDALARCGDLHLVSVLPADAEPDARPPALRHVPVDHIPVRRRGSLAALARWASPVGRTAPWASTKLAYDEVGDAIADVVERHRPDVVWVIDSHLAPALNAMANHIPLVVDLDDLQDQKIAYSRSAPSAPGPRSLRHRFFRLVERVDGPRWSRVQRALAARAVAVLVCSDLDVGRFGHPRVRVVPNGYMDERAAPPRPPAVPLRNRLLFAGNLSYRPNIDALEVLLGEILPVVNRSCPDARVRVVGRTGPEVEHLVDVPMVDFVGEVDSMAQELAGAAACVVPLRSGGGTRIKILEAFARRVPVVTTSVGAEGLAIVDEVHLLCRDEPHEFADACVRLLRDPDLGVALASAAAAHYEATATPNIVRAAVAAVIDEWRSTARFPSTESGATESGATGSGSTGPR